MRFLSRGAIIMPRFYIECDEIDVQDPIFFIQHDEYIEIKRSIEEIISYI